MKNIQGVDVDKHPDTCSICHYAIDPALVQNSIEIHPDFPRKHNILTVAFRCPKPDCRALFVAYYYEAANHFYVFQKTLPRRAIPPSVDEKIHELSPQFIKIYGQASQAETAGLDEIQGVGLRKALEFLIKDYCISKHSDKEEQIKKAFLSVCIENYITDHNIKACAKRATWLGNDETHYIRVWTEHDILDLEKLIKLTCNWITNELLTAEYLKDMAPDTKS